MSASEEEAAPAPVAPPAPPPAEGRAPAWTPGASLADEDPDARADMPLHRRAKRALRAWIKYPLMRLAFWLLPWVYMGYCWLVWKTSRHVEKMEPLKAWRDENDGVIAGLWHEEVFTVAWGYRDYHGHTLASVGDAGEAITRLLEKCNFTVFRGGSAKSRTRRREVVPEMVHHMQTTRRVIYGITVDGSMGPRYKLKKGMITIARACRRPVAVARMWYKRSVRLPTWDRMAIPLPFNVIIREARGPFWPPDTDDPAALEAFRLDIEHRLLVLGKDTYEMFGQEVPPELMASLAENERARSQRA